MLPSFFSAALTGHNTAFCLSSETSRNETGHGAGIVCAISFNSRLQNCFSRARDVQLPLHRPALPARSRGYPEQEVFLQKIVLPLEDLIDTVYKTVSRSKKIAPEHNILKFACFWCAASTHQGEEEFCINVHLNLKKTLKNMIASKYG